MNANTRQGADAGHLTIGAVAKLSGVPAKTIRYYEDAGLLPVAERAANGYRVYGQRTVDVLRFVSRARTLGFSIKDVQNLLALWSDQQRASVEVQRIARDHITTIERKIEELESMRATLLDLADRCHGDSRPDCPILDELSGKPRTTVTIGPLE